MPLSQKNVEQSDEPDRNDEAYHASATTVPGAMVSRRRRVTMPNAHSRERMLTPLRGESMAPDAGVSPADWGGGSISATRAAMEYSTGETVTPKVIHGCMTCLTPGPIKDS